MPGAGEREIKIISNAERPISNNEIFTLVFDIKTKLLGFHYRLVALITYRVILSTI